MNAQEERDLAAEARHGGQMFCHWPHARVWTPDTLQLAARILVAGSSRTAALPESAFDWPVYRAAMQCVPHGNGSLGPSQDVSRTVKDHLNDIIDGYPIEFDELMGERFPKGY